MARLAEALENTRRGRGLDVSGALGRRLRPMVPLERLEPDEAERGGDLSEVLLALVCALGAAALYLV